jgi:hypothetical protein
MSEIKKPEHQPIRVYLFYATYNDTDLQTVLMCKTNNGHCIRCGTQILRTPFSTYNVIKNGKETWVIEHGE